MLGLVREHERDTKRRPEPELERKNPLLGALRSMSYEQSRQRLSPNSDRAPVEDQEVEKAAQQQESRQWSGQELISAWRQGAEGNCVTVAAIKCAQTRFGTELANAEDANRGIFSSAVRTTDGGLEVTMRDGFKCSLSAEELAVAAKRANFRSSNPAVLKNAVELYAVAAKRAQIDGNDGHKPGAMSYERALTSLNDGEHTSQIMEQVGRRGLSGYAKKVKRGELKNYAAGLANGDGHAYFVTKGARDHYGKSIALGSTGSWRRTGLRRRSYVGGSQYGTVLTDEQKKE